jgi:hypothetical protein
MDCRTRRRRREKDFSSHGSAKGEFADIVAPAFCALHILCNRRRGPGAEVVAAVPALL